MKRECSSMMLVQNVVTSALSNSDSPRQRFEAAHPTFGFMLCVIEKERPYQTTQLSAALSVAESRFVFDEGLICSTTLPANCFSSLRSGSALSVNLLMEDREVSRSFALSRCDFRRHQ